MKLVWLDIESTGLDPLKCEILEIVACVTDITRPFDVPVSRVKPLDPAWGYRAVFHHVLDPARVDPFVVQMHTQNKLWEKCAKSSTTLAEAEAALIALVGEPGLNAKGRKELHTLAGSSVHFDLSFLRVHMPKLASKFSHRVYDVTAIKLFCLSIGLEKLPKAKAHRALSDVCESIEHAKRCADWLQKKFGSPPAEVQAPASSSGQPRLDPVILHQGLERLAKEAPDLWSRMMAKTTLKGAER